MSAAEATLQLSELEHGIARRVMVGDVPVALVRIDDDVYAIGDICSHAEVSLSGWRGVLRREGDRVPAARQRVQPRDR